ncbi:hypothetical protein [Streptomyces katsurahamanus]|uniref:Uncharacterized protein n=1 Tax=Streptomyces katsurahamanus TaxID=2577098 RepID=A0ABW9NMQ2_9ACTN|nr:hypothetical protein [Streptomyces katsurahamanus]MQS34421.1 hypothetical protein [Streptomyces katsurahamanus]
MRSASGRVRAAGAWGHLLLVVLALGVFAMHTTGHPDSGSGTAAHSTGHGSGGTAAHSASGASGILPADTAPVSHTVAPADTAPVSPVDTGPASHAAAPVDAHGAQGSGMAHDPDMAMDMTTLCVAVLVSWILAVLLRVALRRGTGRPATLPESALAVPRRGPPPLIPDLSRLPVLRI